MLRIAGGIILAIVIIYVFLFLYGAFLTRMENREKKKEAKMARKEKFKKVQEEFKKTGFSLGEKVELSEEEKKEMKKRKGDLIIIGIILALLLAPGIIISLIETLKN